MHACQGVREGQLQLRAGAAGHQSGALVQLPSLQVQPCSLADAPAPLEELSGSLLASTWHSNTHACKAPCQVAVTSHIKTPRLPDR